MNSFLDNLAEAERALVNSMRTIILQNDRAVTEKPGKIMQAKDAICYNQDGVFKYGLAHTSKGVTFHSMVMYAKLIYAFAATYLSGWVTARIAGTMAHAAILTLIGVQTLTIIWAGIFLSGLRPHRHGFGLHSYP